MPFFKLISCIPAVVFASRRFHLAPFRDISNFLGITVLGLWLTLFPILSAGCDLSNRAARLRQDAKTSFGTIPDRAPSAPTNADRIALGKRLYSDPILSKDHTISCASCHSLAIGGVDRRRVSVGVDGKEGSRNAPTVFNAVLHIAQFWDGRAPDLVHQAGGPILNPVEMAMPDEASVTKRLSEHDEYPQLFRKAFTDADPVTFKNVTIAIADFEKTLLTTDRFDQFQKGDLKALSGREQKGLQLFMELGCVSCHNGALLGGNSYRRLGGVSAYDNITDTGRFAITGEEADRFVFKVPSLRNVAVTGPYFHDGAVPTLEQAIQTMAKIQLGRNLNRLQVAYLADFLRSLTDARFEEKRP